MPIELPIEHVVCCFVLSQSVEGALAMCWS